MNPKPSRPHRLQHVFSAYDPALYFVTFCTHRRKPLPATKSVHDQFLSFTQMCQDKGVCFGRYVIMPDHIHCFLRAAPSIRLGTTLRLLKRSLSAEIQTDLPHWQPGFFDHVLRSGESYAEKWAYVRMNPVRAGL
jgi:putative transposase